MNIHAKGTPDMRRSALDQRQTCVERARPAPDKRGAHALYTHSALATRCAFCVRSLAFPKSWQKLGTRPFPISNALAVRRRTRCMRGPFVQRASNTLCIRGSCYHVRSGYGVYAYCMRPVCAQRASNTLCIWCQQLGARQRTGQNCKFPMRWPCVPHASSLCDRALTP